jgi:hypothetical protein
MLYFLLALIAIGALLASEEGKRLLGWLISLTVIAGLLFLGFWAVVFGISAIQRLPALLENDLVENIMTGIVAVFIGLYFVGLVMQTSRKLRNPEWRANKKEKLKSDVKTAWKEHRAGTITVVVVYVLFAAAAVFAWFTNP